MGYVNISQHLSHMMKIRKVEIHIFYEVEDSSTHVTRRWQHGLYSSTVSRCPSSMHASIYLSTPTHPPRPVPPSPLDSTPARSDAVDAADWNRLRLVLNAAPGEDNNILRTAIRDSRQQSVWASHFVFSSLFLAVSVYFAPDKYHFIILHDPSLPCGGCVTVQAVLFPLRQHCPC